jgi:hypothetical protein
MNGSIFLTCALIGLVLALQMTQYWWRRKEDRAILYWVAAAWILTASDAVFSVRRILPVAVGSLLPTLLVSVGHGVLLLGTQQAAGLARRGRLVVGLIGLQAAGLMGFLLVHNVGNSRMVFNGLFWSGYCLASAWCLRRAPKYFWNSATAPATVFLAQGIFHLLRIGGAILFESENWVQASSTLHLVSDSEVCVFMGLLFISLLLAQLQLGYDELASARVEVETLSGLLPVCAWCKKVRDDEGYWKNVTDYLAGKKGVRVTHSICADCAAKIEREGRPGAV